MGGAIILSAILKKQLSKGVVEIESTLAILRIPNPFVRKCYNLLVQSRVISIILNMSVL